MSCLGILQYLLGNCLWEMIEALGGNHTRSRTACSRLLNMIDVCARSLGEETPINTLTVTMVRASATAKPKFKGKAAESRHFLPIVLQVLSVCFPVDTVHERSRFHCVEALNLCYKEMEDWQASTSPERLGQLARRHLLLWAELQQECEGTNTWALYPKHHMFLHCAESSSTNPRLEWNYGDESEIGAAALVVGAVNVASLPVGLMQRYRATFAPPSQ